MNLNRAGDEGNDGTPQQPERTGMAGRVEAAAKMKAPPPRGKSIAMMILGVLVLAALIYDFTTRGGPSKKVRRITEQQGKAVTAKSAPGEALQLEITHEGQKMTLSTAAAKAYFTSAANAPGEVRPTIQLRMLEALAGIEDLSGQRAQEAYELAAMLIEGADARARDPIADLSLGAIPLLADDLAAPAVAFFLGEAPEGIDRTTARALDKVILDKNRPIHVRIAAAQARPKDGRPDAVNALATDGTTHPQLRKALK